MEKRMDLQITTLIENMADDAGELVCEHGLSLYIEFAGKKILFDTGQTGAFLSNAKKLGKAVTDVDGIIISHGHYDHSGGVPGLVEELCQARRAEEGSVLQQIHCEEESSTLQKTREAAVGESLRHFIPMYVGAEFFHKKYKHLSDGTYRYNGNSFTEADLPVERLALHKITEDITYLEEDIILFKNFKRFTDFEKPNPKFVVERGDATDVWQELSGENDKAKDSLDVEKKEVTDAPNCVQDVFRDELALGLRTEKGLVLIVGCSHVGIVNILRTVMERTGLPVYSVLGGTHLVEADEERLDKTMKALRECGLEQIAVSHCTGEPGMERVAREFGSNFVKNNTGHVYAI